MSRSVRPRPRSGARALDPAVAVRILEEHLINKIAAGEVVERPASVVKELVENALDAGARSLQVHLRAGGRNLVRIVDDGVGMNRTDALMSLERHATSKILREEDLFSVATLGFRGEAVPSIASVSKFDLVTRPHDAEAGTHVRVEGGKLLDVSPVGAAPGTDVSVASLFFNVPARRKFLRSVETELAHCVEAVTREALIRPDLDLEVTHDDRQLLRCAPGRTRAHRAADLLGAHGEALVPVSFTRGTLEVEALLSPVGVHRASPQGSSWLYVNGRYVRDLVVRRAVTAAYAGIVPKDRYPLVILEVRVPPEDVDVNVHPAKTEVRFVNGFALQNAVTEGLRNALREHGIRRPVAVESRYQPAPRSEPAQVGLLPTPLERAASSGSSSWGGGAAPATPPGGGGGPPPRPPAPPGGAPPPRRGGGPGGGGFFGGGGPPPPQRPREGGLGPPSTPRAHVARRPGPPGWRRGRSGENRNRRGASKRRPTGSSTSARPRPPSPCPPSLPRPLPRRRSFRRDPRAPLASPWRPCRPPLPPWRPRRRPPPRLPRRPSRPSPPTASSRSPASATSASSASSTPPTSFARGRASSWSSTSTPPTSASRSTASRATRGPRSAAPSGCSCPG